MAGARPSYAGVLDPLAADDWDDSCVTGLEDSEDTTSDNPAYGSLLGVKRDADAPKKQKKMAIALGASEMAKAAEVMEINAGQLMTNPQRSERITELTGFDPFAMEDDDSLDDVEEAFSAALANDWDEDEDSYPPAAEAPAAEPPLDESYDEAASLAQEQPLAEQAEWEEEAAAPEYLPAADDPAEPVVSEWHEAEAEPELAAYAEDTKGDEAWNPEAEDRPAAAGWEAQAPELGLSGEKPKKKMAIVFDHTDDEELPEAPQDWQAFEEAALGDEAVPQWDAADAFPPAHESVPDSGPEWDALDADDAAQAPTPPIGIYAEVELEDVPEHPAEPASVAFEDEDQWEQPPVPQFEAPEVEASDPEAPAYEAAEYESEEADAPGWSDEAVYARDDTDEFAGEPQWDDEDESGFGEEAEFEPSTPAFDIFAERAPITVDQVKAPIPMGVEEYTNRHKLRAKVVGNYTPEVTLSQRIWKALAWLAKRAWQLANKYWRRWRG